MVERPGESEQIEFFADIDERALPELYSVHIQQ